MFINEETNVEVVKEDEINIMEDALSVGSYMNNLIVATILAEHKNIIENNNDKSILQEIEHSFIKRSMDVFNKVWNRTAKSLKSIYSKMLSLFIKRKSWVMKNKSHIDAYEGGLSVKIPENYYVIDSKESDKTNMFDLLISANNGMITFFNILFDKCVNKSEKLDTDETIDLFRSEVIASSPYLSKYDLDKYNYNYPKFFKSVLGNDVDTEITKEIAGYAYEILTSDYIKSEVGKITGATDKLLSKKQGTRFSNYGKELEEVDFNEKIKEGMKINPKGCAYFIKEYNIAAAMYVVYFREINDSYIKVIHDYSWKICNEIVKAGNK